MSRYTVAPALKGYSRLRCLSNSSHHPITALPWRWSPTHGNVICVGGSLARVRRGHYVYLTFGSLNNRFTFKIPLTGGIVLLVTTKPVPRVCTPSSPPNSPLLYVSSSNEPTTLQPPLECPQQNWMLSALNTLTTAIYLCVSLITTGAFTLIMKSGRVY